MDNRQQRTLAAFETILIFLDQHRVRPEPPLLTGMRKSLRASVDRIEKLGRIQRESRPGELGKVDLHRRRLRRDVMMPLIRLGKPLHKIDSRVVLASVVPHAKASAKEVADAALALADAFKPHTKFLRSAGFPKDFLTQFRQDARTLALITKRAEQLREQRTAATLAMAEEFEKAMQTVDVIEGLIMLHMGSDKETVRFWKERRRVPRRIGRPRKRKPPPPDRPQADAI